MIIYVFSLCEVRMNSYIVSTNDATIIDMIKAADENIMFFGAGMSEAVAEALAEQADIVSMVSLDGDINGFYSGYGKFESIRILKNAGIELYKNNNQRINILITDDDALIYSPIPLSIEGEPNGTNATGLIVKKNAISDIMLTCVVKDPSKVDWQEESVSNSKDEVCSGEGTENNEAKGNSMITLSVEPFSSSDIDSMGEKIADNPPKEFDITRTVRSYQSIIRFVKMTQHGFNIPNRTITIPKEIRLLAENNPEVAEKLKTQYNIFSNEGIAANESKYIERKINHLRDKYLYNVHDYMPVIIVDEIKAFEREVNDIRKEIDESREKIVTQVNMEIANAKKALIDAVKDIIISNPPPNIKWLMVDAIDDDAREKIAESYLNSVFSKCFKASDKSIKTMGIDIAMYDATEEMLLSDSFRETVENQEKLSAKIDVEELIKYRESVAIKE